MAKKKPQPQYLQNQEAQPNWDAGEEFLASLGQEEERPVEKASLLRKAGDLGLGFASGAVGAAKAITDAAGADNVASRFLADASKDIDSNLSEEARADQQRQSAILQEAEGKGAYEGVKAGIRAFGVAPVQTAVQGLGSVVPIIAGTIATGGAGVPAAIVGGGIGATMGAGTVKGSIFDDVKRRGLEAGLSEAEATEAALRAQEYGGENAGNIAVGAGLGAANAVTGVSAAASKMAGAALGRQAATQAATASTRGVIGRGAAGIAGEVPLEMAQGGQERYAANVAAQRAGYDVDEWAGVAGQATLEGLASAGPGAAFGVMNKAPEPVVLPDTGPLSRAANAVSAAQAAAAAARSGPIDYQKPDVPVMMPQAPGQALELQTPAENGIDFEPQPDARGALTRAPIPELRENTITTEAPAGYDNGIDFAPEEAPAAPANDVEAQTFKSKGLAKIAMNQSGTTETHEVLPAEDGSGFVVRPKFATAPVDGIAGAGTKLLRDGLAAIPMLHDEGIATRQHADLAQAILAALDANTMTVNEAQERFDALYDEINTPAAVPGEVDLFTAAQEEPPALTEATPDAPSVDEIDLEETRIGLQIDQADLEALGEALDNDMDPATGKKIASQGIRDQYQAEYENLQASVATATEYLRQKNALIAPAAPAPSADTSHTQANLIDAAAHEAATSPLNDLPQPTEAQKEANNYKVGKIRLYGLDISIENPAGSVRSGVAKDGTPWQNTMQHHYGDIKRTTGADGDNIDVFIGPNHESSKVFIVDQIDPSTGKFDEHKCMLAFDSMEQARAAYQANYADDWTGGKAITETTVEGFKDWLESGNTKKPFAQQAKKYPPAEQSETQESVADAPQPEQVAEEAQDAPGTQAAQESSQAAAEPVLTKQELNKLTVKDMTDAQLLQARDVFAGGARAPKIEKEINKRGLDAAVPPKEAANAGNDGRGSTGPDVRAESDDGQRPGADGHSAGVRRTTAGTHGQQADAVADAADGTADEQRALKLLEESRQLNAQIKANSEKTGAAVAEYGEELRRKAEAAARPSPAKQTKRPTAKQKQAAAEQALQDVLGAKVGDTITFNFTSNVGYLTSGKPMVIESVDSRGEVYFRDPAKGSGTSEKLSMLQAFAKNPHVNLTWEVQPKAEPAAKAEPKPAPAESAPAPSDQPQTVKVPPAVSEALENQLRKQKARITRLKNESDKAVSMADKAQAQTKIKAAEASLRQMRSGIFNAEDAAIAAIEAGDIGKFAEHEMLFPDAHAAVQAEIAKAAPTPELSPLTKARNDLIEMRTRLDAQGMIADDRLLTKIRQQEALIKELEAEQASDGQNDELDAEMRSYEAKADAKPVDARAALKDEAAKAKAQADLMDGLADLAGIFGKNAKLNITPEQEQKLMPVLSKVMDAAFRLGYYKFKDAARFVINTIRDKIGADVADQISLDHVQGAYITMAGKYKDQGASTKKEVIAVDSLEELADDIAKNQTQDAVESPTLEVQAAPTMKDQDNDPATTTDSLPIDFALVAGQRPAGSETPARGAKAPRARSGRANARSVRGQGGSTEIANDGQLDLGNGAGLDAIPTGQDDAVAGGVRRVSADFRPAIGGLTREGSWFDTASRNIDLIELAIAIDKGKRPATPDEQARLAKYVGFGASAIRNPLFPIPPSYAKQQEPNRLIWPQYVEPRWKPLAERLDALPREWQKSLLQSTQYAHYTSEGIVRSVWSAMQRMGFTGGKIMEPGMGIGSFAMLMPESIHQTSTYTGIEFDGPTALIAKLLSPDQNMIHGDFIKRKLPRDFFDAAIGNPPFSQTKVLADPDYEKHGFMLHDFFFAKSIDRVRPGGLLAFVTSKGTMDKQTDKARKYLAERADLIGAIRLPSTAFEGNAGTSVVTDVIFLRKRAPGAAPAGQAWQNVATVETKDGPVAINEYFAANPEMVLGQNRISGNVDDEGRRINSNGMGGEKYTVVSYDETPAELDAKFAAAIERLPENVYSVMAMPAEQIRAETAKVDFDPSIKRDGVVYLSDDGTLMRVEQGVGRPLADSVKLTEKDLAWMKSYIGLRDLVQVARAAQAQDGSWEKPLKALNKAYDAFRKEHGPINAFRTQVRKSTDEDGNPVETEIRIFTNRRRFREDYDAAIVTQLETINEAGEVVKAPFLLGRTIGKPVTRTIQSIGDALAVSLDAIGRFDLNDVAGRINLSEDEAIAALGEQIYKIPAGQWQLADEYLSGDVVTKLEEAEEAARLDASLKRNVEALKKAQPEKLGPSQISAKLGASWIPVEHVNEFAREIEAGAVTFDSKTETWQVEGGNQRTGRRAGAEYGTAARSPSELLEAALNSRSVKVTGKDADGKTVVDAEATTAATEALKKIKDKFKGWVWTDANRAAELVETYNKRYNNIAPRLFDGSHLTLPGVSLRFKLHPHQLRAIWRVIQTGNTYLAHAVGAGKTIEMIAAGMEQKRLGLVKKPMYVVPNHMLEQFSNEFMELYPLANIMVADDENFSPERRRAFIASATLNAPDAIIITHDAFQRIGVKEDSIAPIRDEILADLEMELESVAKDSGARVRRGQLEQQIEAVTQRFDRIINAGGKDSTIKFEDIGADFIFADEAHVYRKLDFHTAQQIKGIDPNGSKRALDMYVKTRYLEKQHPGRSMGFASGTPVTNTMGELYTIMRYFAADELDRAGIASFDAWARMFGEVVPALEPNAAGKYEIVERFARFDNVPELMSRVRQFMDVLTSEHLGALVKRPDLAGGKPNLNIVAPTAALDAYMKGELARRIEISKKWKPSKEEPANPDPIVAIITDGRFAAIDPRFFGGELEEGDTSIIHEMADKAVAEYHATAANVYVDKDKNPEPIKGGTQIVFYNLGFGEASQRSRGFNSRAAFTKRLTDGGIKREHIAWFDDANTDAKKEAIFKAMRAGQIRVLIGSAKKMGTGVNVQKRLTKLHYQDPPWYPADVEQPHGRIIRQGNQNSEVGIEWYTTKGTYQSTMWQMVARKQRFIDQAFTGDKNMRSMDDMGEASLFEQAAAVASGDPRAIQLAGLKQDVERFERLQAAHANEQIAVRSSLRSAEWQQQDSQGAIARLSKAYKAIGEKYFTFTAGQVEGRSYDKVGEFGQALKDAFNKIAKQAMEFRPAGNDQEIGKIGDKISVRMVGRTDEKENLTGQFKLYLAVDGLALESIVQSNALGEDVDAVGLGRRVGNQLNGIEADLRKAKQSLTQAETDIVRLAKKMGAPFEYQQEMLEKYGELKRLEEELRVEGLAKPPAEAQPAVINADGTAPGEASQDGAAPTYSRGAGAGMTLETAQAEVDRLSSGWANAPRITVVQSVSHLRNLLANPGIPADVRGAYLDGRAWIVAENNNSPLDVQTVLFHEVLGHAGLRGLFGDDLRNQLIALSMKNENIRAAAAKWRATNADIRGDRDDSAWLSISIEEALADMAGQGAPVKGFDKFMSALQAALRAIGFSDLANWLESRTDAEALAVLANARQFIERGDRAHVFGAREAQAYNRPPKRNLLVERFGPAMTFGDWKRRDAFNAWFGDSKVVDAEGKPLVVYHGTARDFDSFDSGEQGSNFDEFDGAFPRDGFWFTDAADNATWYAGVSARKGDGQRIVPAYLSLQNPYRYTAQMFAEEGEAGIPSQYDLERQGYDGIIVELTDDEDVENPAAETMWAKYTPVYGAPINWPKDLKAEYNRLLDVPPTIKHTHYVAFRPEQIKSAIGNNGEYDPGNPDIRYSFAGTRAATADQHALTTAQERLAAGDDAEAVRQATGWFRGSDGKWRFEINDADARLQNLKMENGEAWRATNLADILDHPALFAAYPALANMDVRLDISPGERQRGSYSAGTPGDAQYFGRSPEIQVTAPNMERALSTLLHEIQHGIQTIEGFATGANPQAIAMEQTPTPSPAFVAGLEKWNTMMRKRGYNPAKLMNPRTDLAMNSEETIISDLEDQTYWLAHQHDMTDVEIEDALHDAFGVYSTAKINVFDSLSPYEQYQRSAGEVESRNVQKRQNMTAAERRAAAPAATADVAERDLIVLFNGEEMASAPPPANGKQLAFDFAASESILEELARHDELFRLPKSDKMTVAGIATDNLPGIVVREYADIPGQTRYNFTLPDGQVARMTVRRFNPRANQLYAYDVVDGEMLDQVVERPGRNAGEVEGKDDLWIDVSGLKPGSGFGAMIYNIAATYAHNTGRVFIGDPAGVSDDAMRRRPEQMLSSALKFGTTDHLAPHPWQVAGDPKIGVPRLDWVYGDHLGNIQKLIKLNQAIIENVGGNGNIAYNAEKGQFEDVDGNPLSRTDIKAMAGLGLGREAGAGGATLARHALFKSLLQGQGKGLLGPDGILESLGQQLRDHDSTKLDSPFRELLYSRGNLRSREEGSISDTLNSFKNGTVGQAVDILRGAGTLGEAAASVKDMLASSQTFSLLNRTVGTQFHKATKDADFKRVFTAYNQQTDDTAHYAIEAEKRAPNVLQRLDGFADVGRALLNSGAKYKADLEAIAKPLFANIEGESGVQQQIFSAAELARDFGLNDKQIGMYQEVRASVDASLERLAQTTIVSMAEAAQMDVAPLKNLSLAETARLVKEGTYDGAIGKNIAGMTKNEELHARIDEIVEQTVALQQAGYMPAMRFGNHAVTVFDPAAPGNDPLHFEMFETELARNVAAKRLERRYPGMSITRSTMNQDRFKMFKGVSPETVELFAKFSGMDQDEAYRDYIALAKSGRSTAKRMLGRKGIAGFSEDVTRVLASFITSNARQSAMNVNTGEINSALASKSLARKGDVQREAQLLHEYMSNPQEEAQRLRGFMFLHFIGGSIASAAVNLTQPVLQTGPYLSQYAGAKTAGIMAAAGRMAATGKITNAELKAAMERARADGITDPHEIHNLMADASGSTLGTSLRMRAITKAWGSFFSVSEAFNRRLTFLAAYQTAMSMGQEKLRAKGFKDAYEFSRQAIIETQGLYSKTNRPNWARGAVGATLFTFKQFSISYIEFLSRLPTQQKMLALGILVLAAGLQGIPFAEDAEDLIDTIGQSMGYNTNSKRALREAVVGALGEQLGEILVYGLSSQSNIDLQGRLGMGNLLPGTAMFKMSEKDKSRALAELAGPLGGVLMSVQDSVAKVQAGEILGKTGALGTMAPVAVRNLLQGAEAAQTGIYTDTRGRKVQDVSVIASVAKMLGFQPAEIAMESRKMSELYQDKGMLTAVSSAIAGRWASAAAAGDNEGVKAAMETLRAWNVNNPNTPIRINPANIRRRVREIRATRAERFIKSTPKAMRAQAAEELG